MRLYLTVAYYLKPFYCSMFNFKEKVLCANIEDSVWNHPFVDTKHVVIIIEAFV